MSGPTIVRGKADGSVLTSCEFNTEKNALTCGDESIELQCDDNAKPTKCGVGDGFQIEYKEGKTYLLQKLPSPSVMQDISNDIEKQEVIDRLKSSGVNILVNIIFKDDIKTDENSRKIKGVPSNIEKLTKRFANYDEYKTWHDKYKDVFLSQQVFTISGVDEKCPNLSIEFKDKDELTSFINGPQSFLTIVETKDGGTKYIRKFSSLDELRKNLSEDQSLDRSQISDIYFVHSKNTPAGRSSPDVIKGTSYEEVYNYAEAIAESQESYRISEIQKGEGGSSKYRLSIGGLGGPLYWDWPENSKYHRFVVNNLVDPEFQTDSQKAMLPSAEREKIHGGGFQIAGSIYPWQPLAGLRASLAIMGTGGSPVMFFDGLAGLELDPIGALFENSPVSVILHSGLGVLYFMGKSREAQLYSNPHDVSALTGVLRAGGEIPIKLFSSGNLSLRLTPFVDWNLSFAGKLDQERHGINALGMPDFLRAGANFELLWGSTKETYTAKCEPNTTDLKADTKTVETSHVIKPGEPPPPPAVSNLDVPIPVAPVAYDKIPEKADITASSGDTFGSGSPFLRVAPSASSPGVKTNSVIVKAVQTLEQQIEYAKGLGFNNYRIELNVEAHTDSAGTHLIFNKPLSEDRAVGTVSTDCGGKKCAYKRKSKRTKNESELAGFAPNLKKALDTKGIRVDKETAQGYGESRKIVYLVGNEYLDKRGKIDSRKLIGALNNNKFEFMMETLELPDEVDVNYGKKSKGNAEGYFCIKKSERRGKIAFAKAGYSGAANNGYGVMRYKDKYYLEDLPNTRRVRAAADLIIPALEVTENQFIKPSEITGLTNRTVANTVMHHMRFDSNIGGQDIIKKGDVIKLASVFKHFGKKTSPSKELIIFINMPPSLENKEMVKAWVGLTAQRYSEAKTRIITTENTDYSKPSISVIEGNDTQTLFTKADTAPVGSTSLALRQLANAYAKNLDFAEDELKSVDVSALNVTDHKYSDGDTYIELYFLPLSKPVNSDGTIEGTDRKNIAAVISDYYSKSPVIDEFIVIAATKQDKTLKKPKKLAETLGLAAKLHSNWKTNVGFIQDVRVKKEGIVFIKVDGANNLFTKKDAPKEGIDYKVRGAILELLKKVPE